MQPGHPIPSTIGWPPPPATANGTTAPRLRLVASSPAASTHHSSQNYLTSALPRPSTSDHLQHHARDPVCAGNYAAIAPHGQASLFLDPPQHPSPVVHGLFQHGSDAAPADALPDGLARGLKNAPQAVRLRDDKMYSYSPHEGDSDSDDDYDMHQGGAALVEAAGAFAVVDSSMDDLYFFDGLSEHSSDDDLDDAQQQPHTGLSQLGLSLPANIPPHLQLPVPPALLLDNGSPAAATGIQHLMQIQDVHDELDELMQTHPMAISSTNAIPLGPDNLDLVRFVHDWRIPQEDAIPRDPSQQPTRNAILRMAQEDVKRISYDDLAGDECDPQGINWRSIHVSRAAARQKRKDTFVNYVNREGADDLERGRQLQPVRDFFRFQGMVIKRDVRLLHFQLRNILGCSSSTRAFYPSTKGVREVNPADGIARTAMSFESESNTQISTLAASRDVLVAGGFFGDFRYRPLNSEEVTSVKGHLTDDTSGITNHVQLYAARRSHAPHAAFASNDSGFRVVDLGTNQLLSTTMYDCIINCSALSPDSRLRVMVGDHQNVLITDAESGRILQSLPGHSDFGFACDWAPDGWTVATGNQDLTIKVWDARYWNRPLVTIPTELSGARSLRFSPLGSGQRILAAAEEADYINIIKAGSFQTKQTFDVFGEIGGISFTPDGSDLLALCCDPFRGGVLQLSRSDHGADAPFLHAAMHYDGRSTTEQLSGNDWRPEAELRERGLAKTASERRRQAFLAYGDLTPF